MVQIRKGNNIPSRYSNTYKSYIAKLKTEAIQIGQIIIT